MFACTSASYVQIANVNGNPGRERLRREAFVGSLRQFARRAGERLQALVVVGRDPRC
jgi:hypothetical protein